MSTGEVEVVLESVCMLNGVEEEVPFLPDGKVSLVLRFMMKLNSCFRQTMICAIVIDTWISAEYKCSQTYVCARMFATGFGVFW